MAVELNFHAKGGAPEVDRWGRPASPRLAGLGIVPSGTDLPLDGLDSHQELAVSCSAFST